jgi:3',5'-cyclic AMP phosphodiesterase CpdA
MFKLAHLSDPHLPLPAAVPFRKLLSKRLTGYLSWHRKRRYIHDQRVLDALRADLDRTEPDHIAVTGDLTNLALPAEFERAAEWLGELGPPARVSVVPGNHDAYISVVWQESLARLAAFMAQNDEEMKSEPIIFPYVRETGPLALIGVSSAVPMPAFVAAGRIGTDQLRRLLKTLQGLGETSLLRVVLLHHPPLSGSTGRRKELRDALGFRKVIEAGGAELILHGHNHRFEQGELPTPAGPVPVIGVPSASALPLHGGERASYHIYRIEPLNSGWKVEMEIRGYDAASGGFASESRHRLDLPPRDLASDRRAS